MVYAGGVVLAVDFIVFYNKIKNAFMVIENVLWYD